MTIPDSTQTYHDQVKQFFEKTAATKAKEMRFVQRASPLDGPVFLRALVVNVFQYGQIVLDQVAKTAQRIKSEVALTGQAFKARCNEFAVAFLKAMFVEALQLAAPSAPQVVPLLQVFSAVYLLDASTIAFPDSLKEDYQGCGGAGPQAAAKLYLLLNWLTGAYETFQLEAGRKADQNMGERFLAGRPPGALWLFDLGFFKAGFLAASAQARSFFVCRLPAAQQLFQVRTAAGVLAPFALDQLLRRAAPQLHEIEVVFGAQETVTARLIIAPVPPQVAATRRRKLHASARRQGRTPTQKTLNRCNWTLLLTNSSAAQLPTSTVLAVYGVRWQVELAFKLFKSDAQLASTRATEPHRVECEFYAKLIALLLFNRLSGLLTELAGAPLSTPKLWRRLRDEASDWLLLLGQGTAQACQALLQTLPRWARTGTPQKTDSTWQHLALAGTTAQHSVLKDPLAYLAAPPPAAAARKQAFAKYLKRRKITLNPERLGSQRTISAQ